MATQDYHNSPAYQKAWGKYVSDALYEYWNCHEELSLEYHPISKTLGDIDLRPYMSLTVRELIKVIEERITKDFIESMERKRKSFDACYELFNL